MELILHIGTEKTGSTALQEHLERHRDALRDAGIALPDFLDSSNHRALASVFVDDALDDDYLRVRKLVDAAPRRRHREKLLRGLRKQVEQSAAACDHFLISSEHFHSRLLMTSEVQAFVDAVAPLFDGVRVICYLRRQDRMALSFYTQKLRGGFIPPSILPLANVRRKAPALPPFFDFESLLQRWAGALGSEVIEPVVYSKATLAGGNVVTDFYTRIGCLYPGEDDAPRANESLSCAAQMALLAFNRAKGGDLDSRNRARTEREALCKFLQRESTGAGVLPSHEEAAEFLDAFSASNGRIARQWFDRDELFPEDATEYPERESAPDWEEATQLLARFLASNGSHA